MPNIPISSLPLTTSVCSTGLVPIVQNGVTFSTYSCLLGTGGGGGGSINCIIAGCGASISPSTGVGNVTISSTCGGGGVDGVIAGSGISISSATGDVIINIVSGSINSPMVTGSGFCSIVGNCSLNTASGIYSFIGGGCNNNTSACASYSFIGGGQNNTTNSSYSAILGGFGNTTNNCQTYAFGCCLNANCSDFFYVNNFFACGQVLCPCTISLNSAACISNGTIVPYAGSAVGVLVNAVQSSTETTVRCGLDNNVNGSCYNLVLGCNNTDSAGKFNFISGGTSNFMVSKCYVSVLGLNVFCPSFSCTTYVNNLALNNFYNCSGLLCVGNNKQLELISSNYILNFQGGCCSIGRPSVNAVSCGDYLANYGDSTSIFGCFSTNFGRCCTCLCSNDSTIGGGFNNQIIHNSNCNGQSFLAGGSFNSICFSTNSTIINGQSTQIVTGLYNSAGGGSQILGGCANTAIRSGRINNGSFNFLGFTDFNRNQIQSAGWSTISGGYVQGTTFNGNFSNIGNGRENRISGNDNTIMSGAANTISANLSFIGSASCSCFFAGTNNSTLSGYRSSIGCCFNTAIKTACNFFNGKFATSLNSSFENTNCDYTLFINAKGCNQLTSNFGTTDNSIQFVCMNNSDYSHNSIAQALPICSSQYSNVHGQRIRFQNSSNSSALRTVFSCILNSQNSFIANGFFSCIVNSPYSALIGCCITNNVPCSFMSQQLIACNIFGAASLCADANGIISPVVSDLRVKQNIQPLDYGIKEIKALNPVSYKWADAYKEINGLSRKIGFIAQEVQKIIPEAVSSQNDKYIFDDKAILPVIVKSIQQISNRISILNQKIDSAMNK